MPYLFNVEEWGRLTRLERIESCRKLAARTRLLSKRASGEAVSAYILLADHWDRLADRIETASVTLEELHSEEAPRRAAPSQRRS